MTYSAIGLRTLVLSNDFQPLSIFPLYTIMAEDAISRVLNETCHCVLNYNRKVLCSSRNDLYWPSIIVNKNGFAYRNEVKLKKESLFYRDHGKCMYCEGPLTLNSLTFDHVVPRSHGGGSGWENVVAACTECNTLKANNLPKGRWVPRHKPYKPTFFELLEIRKKFPIIVDDPRWIEYLGEWKSAVKCRFPVNSDIFKPTEKELAEYAL